MVSIEERIRSLEHRLRVLQKLPPIDQGRTHLSGVVLQEVAPSTDSVTAAEPPESDSERISVSPLENTGHASATAAILVSPQPPAVPFQPPPTTAAQVNSSIERDPSDAPVKASATPAAASPKKIKYVLRPKKPQQRQVEAAEDAKDDMSIMPKRKFRVVYKPKETTADEKKNKTFFSSTFTLKGTDLSPFDVPVESMYFVNKKKCQVVRTSKGGSAPAPPPPRDKEATERRKFYPTHKMNVGLNPSFTDDIPAGGLTRALASTPPTTPYDTEGPRPATRPATHTASVARRKSAADVNSRSSLLATAPTTALKKFMRSPRPRAETNSPSPGPEGHQPQQPSPSMNLQKRASNGVRLEPISPPLSPPELVEAERPRSELSITPDPLIEEISDGDIDEYLGKRATAPPEDVHLSETAKTELEEHISQAPEKPRSIFSSRGAGRAKQVNHTLHTHTENILFDLDAAGEREESARLAHMSGGHARHATSHAAPRGTSADDSERDQTVSGGPRSAVGELGRVPLEAVSPSRCLKDGSDTNPSKVRVTSAAHASTSLASAAVDAPRAPVPLPLNPVEPALVRPAWLDQQMNANDKVLLDLDSLESKTEYQKLYHDFGHYLTGEEDGLLELWGALGGTKGWQNVLRPAQLSLLLSQELIMKVRFRVRDDWLTYLGGTSIPEAEVSGFFSAVLSRLPYLEFIELFDCPVRPFSWDTVFKAFQPFPTLKGVYFLYTNWTSADVLQLVQLCPGIEKGKVRTDTYMQCISSDQLTEETMGKVLVRAY